MRVTSPRLGMLKVLAAAKRPLSAEQIYEAAGDDKLDLVTIYRSLGAMDDAGIVQRHPLERGRSLYALVSPGHHHHHVICRRCGGSTDCLAATPRDSKPPPAPRATPN